MFFLTVVSTVRMPRSSLGIRPPPSPIGIGSAKDRPAAWLVAVVSTTLWTCGFSLAPQRPEQMLPISTGAGGPEKDSRRGRTRRLPEMPDLDGLSGIQDSRLLLEGKLFGENLIRDYSDWSHREQRRLEGSYCPNIERRARVYAKRYNLSMPRARLVASLDGGAV